MNIIIEHMANRIYNTYGITSSYMIELRIKKLIKVQSEYYDSVPDDLEEREIYTNIFNSIWIQKNTAIKYKEYYILSGNTYSGVYTRDTLKFIELKDTVEECIEYIDSVYK